MSNEIALCNKWSNYKSINEFFSDKNPYKEYIETNNKNKYIWGANVNSVGIISTSCETYNLYNYFYVQNGKDVEVYFLPIDWSL